MKIENETRYSTKALRRILVAVHAAESNRLPQWDHVGVRVSYSKAGDRPYTGHAYIRGAFSHLSVPRGGCLVDQLAALWRHELWHLYGRRHGDYPNAIRWCDSAPFAGLHTELGLEPALSEVEEAAPAPRHPEEVMAAKVAALVARRTKWITKARRAATAIQKIDRALARYRKRGVEVADLPEAPRIAASKKKSKRRTTGLTNRKPERIT